MNGFLPISRSDMEERGIKQFDFVYITGDAYVDHPSFGVAIISRVLEDLGYTVGIIHSLTGKAIEISNASADLSLHFW